MAPKKDKEKQVVNVTDVDFDIENTQELQHEIQKLKDLLLTSEKERETMFATAKRKITEAEEKAAEAEKMAFEESKRAERTETLRSGIFEQPSLQSQGLQSSENHINFNNTRFKGPSNEMASPRVQLSESNDNVDSHVKQIPRQVIFDGKGSWEGFFRPFQAQAKACQWNDEVKLFRLTSSLRGDAAEYAFCHLSPSEIVSYESLVQALELRYRESRVPTSYLAALESRKLQPKEEMPQYIADIKRLVIKSYPTADNSVRETVGLRNFLKGLPDEQAAVSVGMTNPVTVAEAQAAYEMYMSLKSDLGKTRLRSVNTKSESSMYVTKNEFRNFSEGLNKSLDYRFNEMRSFIHNIGTGSNGRNQNAAGFQRRPPMDKKNIECFNCHEKGHIARECQKRNEPQQSEN